MRTTLLAESPSANLTMSMQRVQLSQDAPSSLLTTGAQEVCLYVLTGGVNVAMRWNDRDATVRLENARRTVQEPQLALLRVPINRGLALSCELTTYAADILCVTNICGGEQPPDGTFAAYATGYNHHVGTGTHERWVREVVTPPGYTIHCGETLNVPGGWSSWPSHAAPDEIPRYAEHEELFFVITPGYGLMHCDGLYPDGTRAPEVQKISNGQALRTPLGSHEIVFSPGDWGYYAWFYRSFLQKQYNKWATDGVKTYVK